MLLPFLFYLRIDKGNVGDTGRKSFHLSAKVQVFLTTLMVEDEKLFKNSAI